MIQAAPLASPSLPHYPHSHGAGPPKTLRGLQTSLTWGYVPLDYIVEASTMQSMGIYTYLKAWVAITISLSLPSLSLQSVHLYRLSVGICQNHLSVIISMSLPSLCRYNLCQYRTPFITFCVHHNHLSIITSCPSLSSVYHYVLSVIIICPS